MRKGYALGRRPRRDRRRVATIVRDRDGVLIDGRNRLQACQRANVEPTYTQLNGADPVAFVLSANVQRRHLNKGQSSMAVAKAQVISGKSQRAFAKSGGTSQSRIAYAATVLQYAPELADSVLAGSTPLNDAYEEAKNRMGRAAAHRGAYRRGAGADNARSTHRPDFASTGEV